MGGTGTWKLRILRQGVSKTPDPVEVRDAATSAEFSTARHLHGCGFHTAVIGTFL
jgi:hypothetical protein